MGNLILNKARYANDNDEWYTTYKTVEGELEFYKNQFYGKTVFCNCDDPSESAFAKYFLKNFHILNLEKLICTSYVGSKIPAFKNTSKLFDRERGKSYAMIVNKDVIKGRTIQTDDDIVSILKEDGVLFELYGDGDFRSNECIEYLKQSDIVVTNPPFSKFQELFSLLVKYDKQYLLISNQNAITYKEIFPFIKRGEAKVGYHFGDMAFKVPDDTEPRRTRFWVDEMGQKWRSLGNAMWLTNLKVSRERNELKLIHKYDERKYPKYDSFDAIHVGRVAEIPYDYDGVMGVPITFLKYHNENQFEIVGEANHGSDNEYDFFKPTIESKEVFKRILIRKISEGNRNMNFNILDLFCGAGGMSYGLHQNSNFTTKVALDINEKLAQTFAKNFADAELVIGDIKKQDVKNKVIELAKKNHVNMIVGGPPCQGFSLKGKKLGLEDPRNFLFLEYLHMVKNIEPEIFVIENVKSLLSTANGWFRDEIISRIEALGYFVSFGVLTASDFGVPQNRERAIFICSKNKILGLPMPNIDKPTTVRESIYDLAYLESGEGEFEQNYATNTTSRYQEGMRKGSSLLYNHKASNHTKGAIEKLRMIPPEKGKEYLPKELLGKQQYNSTWGRLVWDEPSPTIDTRFDAASNGRNNHPFLNRSITPREAARLQSFDDKFVFYGNKVDIRTQIGNAVPPMMSKAIADHIEETLQSE